ncbi:MAG TPA: hypothetical protein VFP86_13575 [bacterium]|nr:hypothetical protein [bacterium]
MWRLLFSIALSGGLAASLYAANGQAAVPLAVTISRLQMIASGRVGFNVAIAGFQPELRPTIEGRATLGGQTVEGPQSPLTASRIPAFFDLPAGRVRIGGDASVAEFTPVPPFTENTPVAIELTVRQGGEVATARQTGVLLLPTVIVPGYLNDMAGKPDQAIMSVLGQRGYDAGGASPNLFWFTYPSRSLDLEKAAWALAAYVRDVVLPASYAARINVVGYSLGGLMARWNLAFEPGWDRLVDRFVMVGVPNEGAVMSYVDAWYPLAAPWAGTPAARSMLPTFPFWRPAPGAPWGFPPNAQNPVLAELNTHALPERVRAYAFFGNRQPDPDGRGTWAGITGQLPGARFSPGPGDGIVLAASALGLPINGGAGVPGLADRLVMKVDLGDVRHLSLLGAASSKIADVLVDQKTADRITPSSGNDTALPSLRGGFLTVRGGQ